MARRDSRYSRRIIQDAWSSPRDSSRRRAEGCKDQFVWIFLPPGQAAFVALYSELQIILIASRNLAGPDHPARARAVAQHDIRVVIQSTSINES